jgi:Icc-related predicted phosphoesterase
MLRLVCISDTHGLHHQLDIPDGDVLIHAGDVTRHGQLAELHDLNAWLRTQPHPYKIVIAGNHDRICEEIPDMVPNILSSATYLCDESLQIGTTHFFGAPWTPGSGGWAFSRSLNALSYHWAQIPDTTTVLITHGAPLGWLDQNARGEPLGDPTLARAVQSLRPRVHVFGHIHESYGQREVDGITFINASSCTANYSPTNRPIVIDLT